MPRTVSPAVTAAVHDLLPRDPQAAGLPATCWTVTMLNLVLLQTLGVTLSSSALGVCAAVCTGLAWAGAVPG